MSPSQSIIPIPSLPTPLHSHPHPTPAHPTSSHPPLSPIPARHGSLVAARHCHALGIPISAVMSTPRSAAARANPGIGTGVGAGARGCASSSVQTCGGLQKNSASLDCSPVSAQQVELWTHTGRQRHYSCAASWSAVLELRRVQPSSLPFLQLAAPRQPAAPPRKKHPSHLASGASLLPEAHWATLLLRQSCSNAQLLAPAPLQQLRGCHASQGWCHTWTLGHLVHPSQACIVLGALCLRLNGLDVTWHPALAALPFHGRR